PSVVDRRHFLRSAATGLAAMAAVGAPELPLEAPPATIAQQGAGTPGAALEEASIDELQRWMTEGRYTSRQLVTLYLDRIAALDRTGPKLRSIIEVNPDALEIADSLDAGRQARGPRGP